MEERRPKYPGEPRRKRLNFVRDRTSFRSSDEWALTRGSYQDRYGRQDGWEEPPRWRQPPRDPHPQPYGGPQQAAMPLPPPPPMHPHPVDFHGHQGHQGMIEHDHRIVPLNAGHGNGNHNHHGGHDHQIIKVIEEEPRSRMPKYIKYKKASSSRSHSRGRWAPSVYSEDSDEDSFRTIAPRRIGRAWSESTGSDDSFEDEHYPRKIMVRRITKKRR